MRRDVLLFQQGKGGLGPEKQAKSSKGWTAEREVHFHSLLLEPVIAEEINTSFKIMCAVLTHSVTGGLQWWVDKQMLSEPT